MWMCLFWKFLAKQFTKPNLYEAFIERDNQCVYKIKVAWPRWPPCPYNAKNPSTLVLKIDCTSWLSLTGELLDYLYSLALTCILIRSRQSRRSCATCILKCRRSQKGLVQQNSPKMSSWIHIKLDPRTTGFFCYICQVRIHILQKWISHFSDHSPVKTYVALVQYTSHLHVTVE